LADQRLQPYKALPLQLRHPRSAPCRASHPMAKDTGARMILQGVSLNLVRSRSERCERTRFTETGHLPLAAPVPLPGLAQPSFGDDPVAQCGAGRGFVIDADHGEKQLIGDPNWQKQVHVDTSVGEFAEGRCTRAG